jgi:peptidoglycan hydrolase-like protein with peptidoglycan-binding domain
MSPLLCSSARRSIALALPVAVLTLLLAASTATAALPGFAWPVQSVGNRGLDVRAIQSLLRGHSVVVNYTGVFTTDTRSAVAWFQSTRGLPATGVVDGPTWSRLVMRAAPGASREAVLTLQRELNEKHHARLLVTGVFDAATTYAVAAFERHVGLPVDGIADATLWRYLIAHYDLPTFGSTTGLCDYSVGNGAANWGTGAAIGQVEAATARIAAAGYGRVALGDASFEHGGDIPGHATHEVGLDVDLRPMRDYRDQCRWGTNYRLASYDRSATRALIRAIRAAAPGHVKLVYFNDPVLIGEGLTTWYSGHDDHLHVRYCEPRYPIARYRC